MDKCLISSNHNDWETDPDIFKKWNSVYGWDLDVCCWPETAKCENYFTPKENGLVQNWQGYNCWCNPPFDQDLTWVRKAYSESKKPNTSVFMLIIPKTCSVWWYSYVSKATAIIYFKGRMDFYRNGTKGVGSSFHNCFVIFDSRYTGQVTLFTKINEPVDYRRSKCIQLKEC